MRKTKIGRDGIVEELPETQKNIINTALYYSVREVLNNKIEKNKTGLMRKALDIMKQQDQKPNTSHMCDRALEDFFISCQMRDWTDELKEIPWLEVGES